MMMLRLHIGKDWQVNTCRFWRYKKAKIDDIGKIHGQTDSNADPLPSV